MSLIVNRAAKLLSICAVALSSTFALAAAKTNPKITVHPTARIVEKVDVTKVTTIPHSHSTRVANFPDLGRVDPSTPMEHLMLVLKGSEEQELGLQTLLDQQQDRGHANFHQWVTPEQFGAAFGVEKSDLAQITGWLQQAGLTVNSVAKGGLIIDFTGTAGKVEAAFNTELHNYTVNGETRISNSTDVSIPEALATVVVGPAQLNNFRPIQMYAGARKATFNKNGKIASATPWKGGAPQWSDGFGDNYVGAADLQVLYDTLPLYAAGITGAGQTIGIIGQTDILPADDESYRSFFGLPPNPYVRIQVGNDPGFIADDVESDLDVELSGSLGYNATIDFITSGNSFVAGGIDSSTVYLVDQNAADIISESYGECEQDLTLAVSGYNYNGLYNTIWGQAAAQGQSVFISTGDSGPDVCDDGATYGSHYSVNGLSSTPYTVAAGGTEFDEQLAPTQTFWGPASVAIPFESALSNIPEVPWNEGPWGIPDTECGPLCAGSSGISFFYTQPAWQSGPGIGTTDPVPTEGTIPSTSYVVPGPHRLVPDVSANAAVYQDPTLFCSEGSCQLNPDGSLYDAGLVGGTSVAAPTLSSVQALINQANGGRQGVPNYFFYRVAAVQNATACDSNTYYATATSTCGFHDVVSGNSYQPSIRGAVPPSLNYIGWPTNPGYDLSVGLGSPDVANLVAAWPTVSFHATTTSFTLTPTTSAHGVAYTVAVKVTPASGSGVPTGVFSLIASAVSGNGIGDYPLTAGAFNGTVTGLPGGTYKVYAHYAGDTTFGSSNSPSITVTVSQETPTIAVTTYLAGNGTYPVTTAFSYGANIWINAGLNSPSGVGTPTGSITFTLNNGTANLPTLTVPLDPNQEFTLPGTTGFYKATGYLLSALGEVRDDFAPNYPVLAPGSYTAKVTYPGDNTFTSATSNTAAFTVGPVAPTFTETPVTLTIPVGGLPIIDASVTTVAPTAGGLPPTGTVTFTDTTVPATPVSLGPAVSLVPAVSLANSAVRFVATLPVTGLTTLGAHTITAVYSGDTNYQTSTKTATVTVGGSASVVTLVPSLTTAQVGTTIALAVTVPAPPVAPNPTISPGSVYLFDGTIPLGTIALGKNVYTGTLNEAAFAAGTHVITATYSGSATFDAATSSAVTIVISKNTPTVALTVEQNNTTATSANTAYGMVLTPTPRNANAMNPAPTGSINVLDGTKVLGSGPITYQTGYTDYYVANYTGTALAPGTHSITAQYPGDANYAGYTTAPQILGIGLTTTTLVITGQGTAPGLVLTLTATVAPVVSPSSPALTGTVSFYLNGSTKPISSTPTPVVNGVATLSNVTFPGNAANTIVAVYSGDANYYTSSSAATTISGFTISVSPSSMTIAQGGSGTATVTATSYGSYSGYGTLACTGLPANSYCTFAFPSGNSVQFLGVDGSQTFTVTIYSQGPTILKPASLMWIPAMMLAGFLMLRRKQLSMRGRQLMVFGILLFGMLAVSGCAGGSSVSAGNATPLGNSTVLITASGTGLSSASPNVAPTATIALTVN